MKYTAEELNRSTLEKTVDEFYVKFLDFENNRANILGRNVVSLERPSLSFQVSEEKFKQSKITTTGQLYFLPFNVTFRDDDLNITQQVIYEQLYRQVGKVNPLRADKTFERSKFDMKVEVFSSDKTAREIFTLKQCYITNVSHSTNIMSQADPNRITVTMQCDTIDYEFMDDYVNGDSTSDQTGQLP